MDKYFERWGNYQWYINRQSRESVWFWKGMGQKYKYQRGASKIKSIYNFSALEKIEVVIADEVTEYFNNLIYTLFLK